MSGLPDLRRDLVKEFHIGNQDAQNILKFIYNDMIERLKCGEVLHIDEFGSMNVVDYGSGEIEFRAAKKVKEEFNQIS